MSSEPVVDHISEENKYHRENGIANSESSREIIESVKNYFYSDDEFASIFENFANENCDIFELNEEEMKLEYTNLYNKFVSLFESKICDYIESKGYSCSDFYDVVRKSHDLDPEGDDALFVQIMIATTDFDVFVQLMRETKAEQLRQASRK